VTELGKVEHSDTDYWSWL